MQCLKKGIVDYLSENGAKRLKFKMRNFLFDYLSCRAPNQFMMYTDCTRIKGSFDKESVKNTYTGPLSNILRNNIEVKLKRICENEQSFLFKYPNSLMSEGTVRTP